MYSLPLAFLRLSTLSFVMCSRLLSIFRRRTDWPASGTTWCSWSTFISDGKWNTRVRCRSGVVQNDARPQQTVIRGGELGSTQPCASGTSAVRCIVLSMTACPSCISAHRRWTRTPNEFELDKIIFEWNTFLNRRNSGRSNTKQTPGGTADKRKLQRISNICFSAFRLD